MLWKTNLFAEEIAGNSKKFSGPKFFFEPAKFFYDVIGEFSFRKTQLLVV